MISTKLDGIREMSVKRYIKSVFQRFGYDIHDIRAEQAFFGLKSLPIDVIVDVGANRGQFATRAIKVFPDAKMFCFEPVLETFGKLETWAESVPNRVTVLNVALGAKRGRQEFFIHLEHTVSSSFLKTKARTETEFPLMRRQRSVEIDIHTLDEYRHEIIERETTNILLKLDVEGFEIDVLKGSIKTLENVIVLIVEIFLMELFEGHPTFWDVIEFLTNKNYRFAGSFPPLIKSNTGRIVSIDAIFIREDFFD